MTKAHRKRARKARRFAAEVARRAARPAVAAGLVGSLAVGIAAPPLCTTGGTAEPAVAEVTETVYPTFTAPPWPAFERLAYRVLALEEIHHGPHGHLPHNELIEYRYVEMSAPIMSAASGSPWPTMFNLHLGQAI